MGDGYGGAYASPGLRLLKLFLLLSTSRRTFTLTRLAGLLRCSRQTIIRLIEQLQLAPGIVIDTWLEGRERHYRLASKPTSAPVSFTTDTLHYIALCRDFLRHILPEPVQGEIGDALGAVDDGLARAAKHPSPPVAEPWLKGRIDYRPFEAILGDLQIAMRERRLCRVDYRARTRGQLRRYTVAPLRIVAYREALYLRCRVHDPGRSGAFRTLAIHRIRALRLCPARFADSLDDDREECFGFPFHEPIRVRAAFRGPAAEYVAEPVWSADQTLKKRRDGAIELAFSATNRFEVIAWILGFGPDAELLAPPDLREELKATAAAICGVYGDTRISSNRLYPETVAGETYDSSSVEKIDTTTGAGSPGQSREETK